MSQTGDQAITRICPQCGRVMQEDWKNCPFCGWIPIIPQKPLPKSWDGVYGIIAGVISLFIFGIVVGAIAITFGSSAKSKGDNKGIAGIVLGIIGIIGHIASLVLLGGGFLPF